MFERFTKDARDLVRTAVALIADRGEDKVGTGHLMLALAAQSEGTGARVLAEYGIGPRDLEPDGAEPGPAGLTEEEIAALRAVGVDTDAVFRRVREAYGPDALVPDASTRRPRKRGRLGGAFDPGAKKALELSLREAIALRHRGIGSGHVLLGLLRAGLPEPMAGVLAEHGLTHDAARRSVQAELDDAA